jgi:hypothetical protein
VSSRTRVPYWRPPFREALRLAWRPALVYAIFSGLGAFVMLLTIASYNHNDREMPMFIFGLIVGMGGMFFGQALSLMRIRAAPVFIALFLTVLFGMWVAASAHGGSGDGGEYIAIATLFFCAAFPSGMLSMMHRYELFASFWPAVGWIGSVFIILNEEDRVRQWEQSKITAWLPIPLLFLALFLVLWLLYLASKQAVRVELWQALSGAAQRRIAKQQKKERVDALPRKNFIPLLAVAGVLFVAVAVLAPYLWRTGKGEHGSKPSETESHDAPKAPKLDGDAIVKMLQQMANAAKQTLPKLWPLLSLLVVYRPAKRALLLTHLRTPLVPAPPSERIDNLWEYVRIHAEDTGLVPTSSDSVEELVRRIDDAGRGSKALTNASEIYIRTRYGFVVQPGDAHAMKAIAFEAASGLRKELSPWMRVRSWWRPLS